MIKTATEETVAQIQRQIASLKEKLKHPDLDEIERLDIETEIKMLELLDCY